FGPAQAGALEAGRDQAGDQGQGFPRDAAGDAEDRLALTAARLLYDARMRPGGGERDWTTGPAKWFAVILLGALTAAALAWSVVRGYGPPSTRMTAPGPAGTGRSIESLVESARAAPPAIKPE